MDCFEVFLYISLFLINWWVDFTCVQSQELNRVNVAFKCCFHQRCEAFFIIHTLLFYKLFHHVNTVVISRIHQRCIAFIVLKTNLRNKIGNQTWRIVLRTQHQPIHIALNCHFQKYRYILLCCLLIVVFNTVLHQKFWTLHFKYWNETY